MRRHEHPRHLLRAPRPARDQPHLHIRRSDVHDPPPGPRGRVPLHPARGPARPQRRQHRPYALGTPHHTGHLPLRADVPLRDRKSRTELQMRDTARLATDALDLQRMLSTSTPLSPGRATSTAITSTVTHSAHAAWSITVAFDAPAAITNARPPTRSNCAPPAIRPRPGGLYVLVAGAGAGWLALRNCSVAPASRGREKR